MLPLFGGLRLHGCRVSRAGQSADVGLWKVTASYVAFRQSWGEALLGQEELLRSSLGQFDILERVLACSHREDVAWSGGDVVLCLVCAFFAVLWLVSGDSLVVVRLVVVCPGGGTVVFVVLWWYLVEVGVEVELCSVEVVFPVTLAFEVSVLVPSDSRIKRVKNLKKLFVPSLLLLDLLVQGLSFSSSKLQKVSRVG
ncbi:hypothetical protein Taro_023159 [Colocasia esculenta]|uniref:Uncharacterized protein n=1 Tax=Colocasia esculenta TaxID=4460 RepID=A0A843V3X7_COLES|nr:hypothetical protein [Colocasia esculenta]